MRLAARFGFAFATVSCLYAFSACKSPANGTRDTTDTDTTDTDSATTDDDQPEEPIVPCTGETGTLSSKMAAYGFVAGSSSLLTYGKVNARDTTGILRTDISDGRTTLLTQCLPAHGQAYVVSGGAPARPTYGPCG